MTRKTGVSIHFARNLLKSVTVRNGLRREYSGIKWHKYIRVGWFHLNVFLRGCYLRWYWINVGVMSISGIILRDSA